MSTGVRKRKVAAGLARRCLLTLALLLPAGVPYAASDPLRSPDQAALAEARSLVAGMISDPRGPYSRLRWYCNDGTILPPTPYACQPHGGGRQHAEYSPQRHRLTELGYRVGTVFAALTWEEFWDADNNHQRLKELALERYMTEVADGWVLRRARDYRGRVQIEDEEAAGRRLLLRMLDDPEWIRSNFLLARETARVVPHSGASDLTRDIRRSAQDIAEADPDFEKLRIEIHANPSAASAGRVRRWVSGQESARKPEPLRERAAALAEDLEELYGAGGRSKRLRDAREALERLEATRPVADALVSAERLEALDRVEKLAAILSMLRRSVVLEIEPGSRLLLLDLMSDIEAELAISAQGLLERKAPDRQSLLRLNRHLVLASFGSGLLSGAETRYTLEQIDGMLRSDLHEVEDYLELSRALNRAVSWPYATVRYVFAEALARYSALENVAARFPDDLLRGSPVMLQASASSLVAYDAQLAAGVRRTLSGRPTPALMALNPGVARGRLRVLTDADLGAGAEPERDEIVLLPQTVAELKPVAGILTGGEGNLLSHLQLLARNLGIPNVSVSAALFVDLQPLAGQEIFLAVDSRGSIVINPVATLDEDLLGRLTRSPSAIAYRSLEVPEPDLDFREPITLRDLHGGLSGRIVGPKAANIGQLNRQFPGRVAPALALPFGLFDTHVNGGQTRLRQKLIATYRARDKGDITEAELLAELGRIRSEIEALRLSDETRKKLLARMAEQFGDSEDLGLFIRSDTNVEDLPGFSGAGLSETLFNVVGRERQLAGIPLVWSSILSPRSIAWRANLMKHPERIYASVLLMKSVPADKSGVLVTSDLITRGDALTVSTAWGVGGAVSGETAETLVLMPDGSERLISESKAPYRRTLSPAGGVEWRTAQAGPVLEPAEKRQLRQLAVEVARKYQPVIGPDGDPMPWDVEFGFVGGELYLFQIRPLVARSADRAADILRELTTGPVIARATEIDLRDTISLPGGEKQ